MDWKKLLGSITESVDEELRLRNAYLVAENRILRQQVRGRVQFTNSDRQGLAEIGMKLGKKALEEIATVAKPATILAWHRRFVEHKGDCSQLCKAAGRPRIPKDSESTLCAMKALPHKMLGGFLISPSGSKTWLKRYKTKTNLVSIARP